ncbi:MAG: hypothetical protein BACD_00126 [Bacteroides rodentium]
MTEIQKRQIIQMKNKGDSYSDIAVALNLSRSTVQSFWRRNNASMENKNVPNAKSNESKGENENQTTADKIEHDERLCRNCGKMLVQKLGVRKKFFCSRECRIKWWRGHPEESNGNSGREVVCPCCGSTFTTYWNKTQKYCSHDCYIRMRFGGGGHE